MSFAGWVLVELENLANGWDCRAGLIRETSLQQRVTARYLLNIIDPMGLINVQRD